MHYNMNSWINRLQIALLFVFSLIFNSEEAETWAHH